MAELVRYTPQKKQERRSIHQLSERFDDFGWVPTRPSEDLGEDLIVHVYFAGEATGVLFHVQVKGLTNLYQRREGDYLPYDFLVKDIKHWEQFKFPLVLIIWDVELEEGRWALLKSVITDLNRRLPNWKDNKKKVRVHIPWNNTIDDRGLIRLRQAIGRHFYPLIAEGRQPEINIKAAFPDTDEGIVARKAFERFLKEGRPLDLEGKYLEELTLDPWWMSWFGDFDLADVRLNFTPKPSSDILLVDIDVMSDTGESASMSNIELRKINPATEPAIFSNEHQNSPLSFRFTMHGLENAPTDARVEGPVDITYKVNHWGASAEETRRILNFLLVTTGGGLMRLTSNIDGSLQTTIHLPSQREKAPPLEFVKLVDDLCLIQKQTHQFFQIRNDKITPEDIRAVSELASIIQYGKLKRKATQFTLDIKREGLELIADVERSGKPAHFTIVYEDAEVELLDKTVLLGSMTQHVTGRLGTPLTVLEQAIQELTADDSLTIQFVDVEVVEIFPDWLIREAQRLSRLLVERFGVQSVYLFGSLARMDGLNPSTDIDLAVNDLPGEQYLKAIGFIEKETKFPVNLVDLSCAPDYLRKTILAEGKLLCEREPMAAIGG